MDTTTNNHPATAWPGLPLWRRYGGWRSPHAKVHISEPKDHPVTHIAVLLHGLSQNGAGMLLKNREEIRKELPGAVIIAPDALFGADPDQYLRARRPRVRDKSFAWFDLPKGRFKPHKELASKIRPSVDYVHGIIDTALKRYNLDESSLFISGFSQGGAIAIQTAIERHKPCAGVAGLCCPFFDPIILGMEKPNSRPPIFYGADLGDEVVPAGMVYHALTAMKRLGLLVTLHITPAGPSKEVVRYDDLGRPYRVMMPQPGAPLVSETEVTGHWVNDAMHEALRQFFRQVRANPGHTPKVPGTMQLADKPTPRVTAGRMITYWMINRPKPVSSHIPVEQRPLTNWNNLVWQAKRRFNHLVSRVMDNAMQFAGPLLMDLPEQVAVEVNDRRRLGQLFNSLARATARVLIPKLFDLPPDLARNLETRTRRNEIFVNAGDMNAMMGTPKKPSKIRAFFSRPPK